MRFGSLALVLAAVACGSKEPSGAAGVDAVVDSGPADAVAPAPDVPVPGPDVAEDVVPDVAADAAKDGPVGAACASEAECAGGKDAGCFTEADDGWPEGYCTIECTSATCPAGSDCYEFEGGASYCLELCDTAADCRKGYVCDDGTCYPPCTGDEECGEGYTCGADGLCAHEAPPPCVGDASCAKGMLCKEGACVPDPAGSPGPGPGPTCDALPEKDCTGADCGDLVPFEPLTGPGYDNYALNGECPPCDGGTGCDGAGTCSASGKLTSQWRSYARKDVVMLVKWATAFVACKTAGWKVGNGKPLGLGDMSEADGSIPGTALGDPGHPEGSHTDGYDMDIGYFRLAGSNNYLQPICKHEVDGVEQYHCVAPPFDLDLWRHALFIGALMTSSRVAAVGVDGQVGQPILATMPLLCQTGWLPQAACDAAVDLLAYEVVDGGYGWFQFHHHHCHLSTTDGASKPGPHVKCLGSCGR